MRYWLAVLGIVVGCSRETTTSVCAYSEAKRNAESYSEVLENTKSRLNALCRTTYGEEWFFSEYGAGDEPDCANVEHKPLPGAAMKCD